eukprot:GHVQ01028366.1.p1 GENE.GHVQ01028366.1~~GHVQ01028366.1.p1  ORF type:complete len:181 (+),score=11.67 GHVQ01028366.1:343-885(+)
MNALLLHKLYLLGIPIPVFLLVAATAAATGQVNALSSSRTIQRRLFPDQTHRWTGGEDQKNVEHTPTPVKSSNILGLEDTVNSFLSVADSRSRLMNPRASLTRHFASRHIPSDQNFTSRAHDKDVSEAIPSAFLQREKQTGLWNYLKTTRAGQVLFGLDLVAPYTPIAIPEFSKIVTYNN